jgi:hypothetical protein
MGLERKIIGLTASRRAKIIEKIRQYKFIPLRFRVAPEYYASSGVITE